MCDWLLETQVTIMKTCYVKKFYRAPLDYVSFHTLVLKASALQFYKQNCV
jgi:hypothetical protein